MIKKTLHIIRKNPIIIAVYAIFIVLNICISEFTARFGSINSTSQSIGTYANKMFGLWILIIVISVLFLSGYGNIVAAAVKKEKCSWKDFFSGMNYFLGRMLISFILLVFMAALLFLIIMITAFPLILAGYAGALKNIEVVSALFTLGAEALAVFVYPCLMLWYPAIFIDDTGVIEGLKRGFAASRRCYWTLVGATFFSILPSTVYSTAVSIFNGNTGITPGYIISTAVSVVISLFVFIFAFVVYHIKRGI